MQMARGTGTHHLRWQGRHRRGFFDIGNSTMLGVPTPVWITAVFVLFGLLLNKTTFGRNTLVSGR